MQVSCKVMASSWWPWYPLTWYHCCKSAAPLLLTAQPFNFDVTVVQLFKELAWTEGSASAREVTRSKRVIRWKRHVAAGSQMAAPPAVHHAVWPWGSDPIFGLTSVCIFLLWILWSRGVFAELFCLLLQQEGCFKRQMDSWRGMVSGQGPHGLCDSPLGSELLETLISHSQSKQCLWGH
jgi:hypothetical protein